MNINDFLLPVATLIRQHLSEVCFGITAVTLILAGPAINKFVLSLVDRFHWTLKYLVFMLLCTAGYGFLTQFIYRSLKHWLAYQHTMAIVLITIGMYLALAFFAKKQGHI